MSFLADSRLRQARRPERHDELSRTVRGMRERLAFRRPLPGRMERELLLLHARSLKDGAALLPLPIVLAGIALWFLVGGLAAALWAALASLATLALLAVAGRLGEVRTEAVRSRPWALALLAGHVAVGLAWTGLAFVECAACGPLEFEIVLLAVLIAAIASLAMTAVALRGAVLAGFAPLALALAYRASQAADARGAAILLVPAAAVPLFALIADRQRGNAIERFRHQVEKDELIHALEEERESAEEARRRAEEANHAKSRFLATMSHELRTPLNAILGFSEVITKEILGPVGNPTYREYVEDIHGSGRHLLDLINEILDLSRIEAGRYALNEEAVDLGEIARDCSSYLLLKAQGRGLSLMMRLEPGLPLLWGDRRAIRQLILNLLSNAVKFAPAGSDIDMRVGWTAGGGQYVSIRDRGPGIPADELPLVLSSFGQGSSAVKSAEQGTGLGLPIVRALTELHDGEFRLEAGIGGGTLATAIFPHARTMTDIPAI